MRFRRSLLAVAITTSFVAATAATGAATVSADVDAAAVGARISGPDRYSTSAAVADKICDLDNSLINIIVASGTGFADALAASGLAGQYGVGQSAILLTNPQQLEPATIAELRHAQSKCGIASITIVGGTAAVSTTVETALRNFGPVTRISGATRYATAAAIAQRVTNEQNTILLATGDNFPDALSGGVMAMVGPHALLLNSGPTLRPEVLNYIQANGVQGVIVLGGASAVPESVVAQLRGISYGPGLTLEVERISGPDRFATATAIANRLINPMGGFVLPAANVVLANGLNFPDALSAAPFAADLQGPILLTQPQVLPASTATFLGSRPGAVTQITAIGGTAAVSNLTLTAAITAAGGAIPPTPPPSPAFELRSGTMQLVSTTGVSVVLNFNRRVALPTSRAGIVISAGGDVGGPQLQATAASTFRVTADGFGLEMGWTVADNTIFDVNPRVQINANTVFDTDRAALPATTGFGFPLEVLRPVPPPPPTPGFEVVSGVLRQLPDEQIMVTLSFNRAVALPADAKLAGIVLGAVIPGGSTPVATAAEATSVSRGPDAFSLEFVWAWDETDDYGVFENGAVLTVPADSIYNIDGTALAASTIVLQVRGALG